MVDPEGREARCEQCDHVDWVGGPLAPTPGIVCDICRREPCPKCGAENTMRPTHPFLLANFDTLTNA